MVAGCNHWHFYEKWNFYNICYVYISLIFFYKQDIIKPQLGQNVTFLFISSYFPGLILRLCFFSHQLFWPASVSKIEECQMAGKDPTVRPLIFDFMGTLRVQPANDFKCYKWKLHRELKSWIISNKMHHCPFKYQCCFFCLYSLTVSC